MYSLLRDVMFAKTVGWIEGGMETGWIFQKVPTKIGQKEPHFVTKTPKFKPQ